MTKQNSKQTLEELMSEYIEMVKSGNITHTDMESFLKKVYEAGGGAEREKINWATGDDTGTSSEYLMRYMLGIEPNHWGKSAPSDSDDRGRCIRLLNRFPEWWDRLDELIEVSEDWKEQIPLIKSEANQS